MSSSQLPNSSLSLSGLLHTFTPFSQLVILLYPLPSRAPPGSPRALWHSSRDNCRNRAKSSNLDSQSAKPVPLQISSAHPFSISNTSSLSNSNTYSLLNILPCIGEIYAKGDLSDCAELPALRTTITTYPPKSFRKCRNCMFTLLISISFPCSMVYTTHYLRDC